LRELKLLASLPGVADVFFNAGLFMGSLYQPEARMTTSSKYKSCGEKISEHFQMLN